jgi:hypothetical protein
MESNFKTEDIEKNVTQYLSQSNLNKDELSSISKRITELNRLGFKIIDWSMFGRPAFEKFVLEAQLAADKRASIQNLVTSNDYKEIFILKKGIPIPDFFNVKVTIDKI